MLKALRPATGLLLILIWSCQSDELQNIHPSEQSGYTLEKAAAPGGNGNGNAFGLLRNCASEDVLQRELQENPGRGRKMEQIENQTKHFIQAKSSKGGGGKPGSGGGGTPTTPVDYTNVTIPVVVNVIYNIQEQNISEEQINSQIEVLNQDFSAKNQDLSQLPSHFSETAGAANITFELVKVVRHYSTRGEWGTRNEMKLASKGGIDATSPETHLNIWVCNIGGGILGYAQFPGGATATDGIVIAHQYFGTTGYVLAPYDRGRTATHEVGHWLNLRHIWGDGRCNADDFVADTPSSDRPNYGCPGFPTVHCKTTDMTMNYMDYTDDRCMYMFSKGQADRMRAVLAPDGARAQYILNKAL